MRDPAPREKPRDIWHFLSVGRLGQKIAYADRHDGRLWMPAPDAARDISVGALSSYLYCLGEPLGGALFADQESIALLRIRLTDSARVFSFRGNPDELDFGRLAGGFDLIDMRVDRSEKWPVAFRQLLLLNENAIASWCCEKAGYAGYLARQFAQIKAGKFDSAEFFHSDFSVTEQLAMASMLMRRLGINAEGMLAEASARETVERGLRKLGALA